MAEAQLKCNIQTCRKILDEKAFVTSCSHIFCVDHGQGSVKNENCLACGTKFKNKYDVRITDLQPSDQCKSMILTGLSPEVISEIVSRSISFYTYQLNRECEIKDNLIRQGHAENENLRAHCATITANFKAELDNTKRMAQSLKSELEEKMKDIEKQKEQLTHTSRLNKKLQLQLDSYKRQLMNMRANNVVPVTSTQLSTPQRFEFDFAHRDDSFDFNRSSRKLQNDEFLWPYARHST